MNQQWSSLRLSSEKQPIGAFKVDLCIGGQVMPYEVKAGLYAQAFLVQLDIRLLGTDWTVLGLDTHWPDVDWAILGFVDHKREVPNLIVLSEYPEVRNDADAELYLLVETVNLLPATPNSQSRTETMGKEGHGCYLSV